MCKQAKRQTINDHRDFEQQLEDYYDFLINESGYDPDDSDDDGWEVYAVTAVAWDTAEVLYVVGAFPTYCEADSRRLSLHQTDEEREVFYYDVEGMSAEYLRTLYAIG